MKNPTDDYLNFNNHHQKLGVVLTLFDEAMSLVSDKAHQQEGIDIKEALRHCGYPIWIVVLVEDKQKEPKSKRKEVEKEKKSLEGKERPGLTVLPYTKGLSEAAVRQY